MTRHEHESIYRTYDDEWGSGAEHKEEDVVYQDVEVVDPETGKTQHGVLRTEQKFKVNVDIYKTKEIGEKKLVSGWANIATCADGSKPLDWQGDIIEPEALEEAAINFMIDYRDSGVNHQGKSTGIVVESIVLTKDKQAAMGIPEGIVPEGWFITVKITDDATFEKVKNGEYRMFSIQGTAERVAV